MGLSAEKVGTVGGSQVHLPYQKLIPPRKEVFPGSNSKKKTLLANAGNVVRHGFDPWVRKIPWKRAWQPAPVFLPGESHGQMSLSGCIPQGHRELDTTEEIAHMQPVREKVRACKCACIVGEQIHIRIYQEASSLADLMEVMGRGK